MIYSNKDDIGKRYKAQRYYLPKGIIKNYNVIISRKNIYDQPIRSNTKQYEKIRNLATGHGEDYTARCLLDYERCLLDYIKNHYRLIAVDLS